MAISKEVVALTEENELLRGELAQVVLAVGLLRAAQRQYLRHRGDEAYGAVVGQRADQLDDVVANLQSF